MPPVSARAADRRAQQGDVSEDAGPLRGRAAPPLLAACHLTSMPTEILAGVRVLDFSWVLAGPYATRILADFGAEVIKVQSANIARGAEDNQTGYFHTWNRNKKSITLNPDHPAGRRLAKI